MVVCEQMRHEPPVPTRRAATALALVLAAAVPAATACAVAVSPLTIEAARAEARVKTALVNDPIIGTRVINVRMLGTVAQLTGRVRSQDEAARAAEVAGAVAGVSGVDLRIQIGADQTDAGTELQTDPIRGPAYEFAELADDPNLLALGAGIGLANQQGPAAGTHVSLLPVIRLGTGAGLGPAVELKWFDARAAAPLDTRSDAGTIRVRSIMAGVRYTMPMGRLAVSPTLVGGYAFNSIGVPGEGDAAGLPVAVDDSFVWRPSMAVWFDSGRRTLVHVSIGRALTSPRVTVIESGRLVKRSVSADTTVVVMGLAYRLF